MTTARGPQRAGYDAPLAQLAAQPQGWRIRSVIVDEATSDTQSSSKDEQPFLVPLLSGRQRVVFALLSLVWVCSLVLFWTWWLRPEHNADAFRYVANSLILFWSTIIPGYFVIVFARARVSNTARPIPAGWRVAMVVTKAPSEPFEVVRETLVAMLGQSYPHDTWLADEDPSDETIDWCTQHGVFLSSRRGVAAYHNASWPRRTKCKEGNLAYFYDRFGYERYDFVSQLDADHVPAPGYLEAMLRPFMDDRIGYVSAPSICDSNAATSWSARGRLYAEAALHGALQAGYNGGLAPLCIGSHYAVRMTALRDIGGLGPELAEDHSTTLMMNAKGWAGIHAIDAIAHGEGPRTFADMATQEFQWAKSLTVILFRYTKHYIGRLPWRMKAQFLFSQLWYTLFSLTMVASIVMPAIALWTHRVWASIAYPSYLLYAGAVTISILTLMAWVRRTGCYRPYDGKVLSWEGTLFHFARWPWSLLGSLSALADCLRGREFAFRVTPKTATADTRPPVRVVLPYLLISLFCSLPVLIVGDAGSASGFYVLSIINSLIYLLIAGLIVAAHARERGQGKSVISLLFGDGSILERGVFATTALALAIGLYARVPSGVEALFWRSGMEAPIAFAEPVKGQLTLGIYDPEHVFSANDSSVKLEHVFVSWSDPDASARIVGAFDYATSRHRQLMVTLEPWPEQGWSGQALLREVRDGAYDSEIHEICQTMGALNSSLLVRWGHEMETATGRYPWASNDPAGYIAAYRHFVDQCRLVSKRLRFVWSPRGDRGLTEYFPGRAYVDDIGLSVFDCPECGVQPAGDAHSAASILREKYRRVARYGLPVIVAELGVEGRGVRQREQLLDLKDMAEMLPLVTMLVYFNATDNPGVWPKAQQPDWRIAPSLFKLTLAQQAE
ncbi:glycosyltransferase [Crenobacter sp. SG2303]|uniref:Glycosyltransferase n=1 Tax=Crenobacter oryzisoli TaxID=3056844 RepID=A0ABT7XRM2_9NEIS|nr:glycosyltransferase family 2 protein [Crenobacter sp. SG2303]MDN0076370.1 glycosyltransferase [Crenobacter sp. SG2303]